MIVVVSIKDDLHALAVQDRIRSTSDLPCHVVESDALIDSSGFEWTGHDGRGLEDEAYSDQNAFVSGEWRAALLGALLSGFRGRWVSDPGMTRIAANKLLQLKVAAEIG
ncbi:MAG TPA: hypothetical protein VFV80_08645 [Geminicoccaceae bacterium]|nr:hypothetical protein [Geminicoccaceae bacterium]